MRGARAESASGMGIACPSRGLDRSCRVVTLGTTRAARDRETRAFSSAFLRFFLTLKVVPELRSFHLNAAQGRSLSSFQLRI